MTDIFVSYASEDLERVKPLVTTLEEQGWSVWWDRELVAGPSYEDKIEVMQDLPCTRIMTPAIFAEFLKQIEVYYADKGLILESINEGLRNKAYDV